MLAEAWQVASAISYQELEHLTSDRAFDAGGSTFLCILSFSSLLCMS